MRQEQVLQHSSQFCKGLNHSDSYSTMPTKNKDYVLFGRVVDSETNKPLAFALVKYAIQKRTGSKLIGFTLTADDGTYHFSIPRELVENEESITVHAIKT